MSAPATDLVEKFVAGFIDAILDFTLPASGGAPADTPEPLAGLHLPADSCVSHVGAGITAGSGTLPLPAPRHRRAARMTDIDILVTKVRRGGNQMIRADIKGRTGHDAWINVSNDGIEEAARIARDYELKYGAMADELDRMIAVGETE